MIRPRPFRPQPVYPMVDGFNGPSAFEPFSSHTLPRVASNDQIPSEMKRSGSQDPYNTLRSMRSEGDGFDSARPSPSAFQQVSPFHRGSSMRSSLRSLPDHSPVRQKNSSYEVAAKDPVLSIDQLVAELELNTENVSKLNMVHQKIFYLQFCAGIGDFGVHSFKFNFYQFWVGFSILIEKCSFFFFNFLVLRFFKN